MKSSLVMVSDAHIAVTIVISLLIILNPVLWVELVGIQLIVQPLVALAIKLKDL